MKAPGAKILAGTRDLTTAERFALNRGGSRPIPAGLSKCNHCGRTVIDEQERERQKQMEGQRP